MGVLENWVIGSKFSLFSSFRFFQQHQRPDLSRLMQLQAAGAGLPTSIAGLPPGLLGGASSVAAAAAAAAAASGQHGLMPPGLPVSSAASLASSGHYPPTSSAAAAAAAAAALREQRREEEHNLKAHSEFLLLIDIILTFSLSLIFWHSDCCCCCCSYCLVLAWPAIAPVLLGWYVRIEHVRKSETGYRARAAQSFGLPVICWIDIN